MTGENNQGSHQDMKVQQAQQVATLASQLVASARITGLPDKAFFKSFTPRRRREIIYNVDAEAGAFSIRLEVHGNGKMKARVTMACVSIEDGVVHENHEQHAVSWAHSGEEAMLTSRLDHRHLETFPEAGDVMAAFIEAVDTQTRAGCPGGFIQWRSMMQLFADRIARETGSPIEMVAMLPLPIEQTGAGSRGRTDVEINDITDPEHPVRINGYDEEVRDLDEATIPEAVTFMLLPPGYLVCRRHREIFTAG